MKKRTTISIILTLFSLFLTKNIWLDISKYYIDYCMFFSNLILSFLFFYKITDYLADFNSIKQKSRTEIIFLITFFILLFIPMSKINEEEISVQENRTLAKYPSITENNKINYNFGKDFNNWFNDRFNFRNNLIKLNSFIKISTNKNIEIKQNGFIDKKTDFMYYNLEFYRYNKNELKNNLTQLLALNEFCNKNKIKLYILITPPVNEIYKPTSSIIKQKNNKQFEQTVTDLSKQINIIYPINELKQASKENFVFFKTDEHWTDDGAFIGYNTLMNKIKQDFPIIKPLNTSDFTYSYNTLIRCDWNRDYNYGRIATKIGIFNLDKYHKEKYKYYTHKNFKNLKVKITNIKKHKEKDFYYPYGSDYKVILLGTSVNENLTEFIPFTFKNVKRIRTNNVKSISSLESSKIMKYWEQDILNYKPDILIFCITYNNISGLHNLFKK